MHHDNLDNNLVQIRKTETHRFSNEIQHRIQTIIATRNPEHSGAKIHTGFDKH